MSPLIQGGLGVGSLRICNQAMLCKWWWRYRVENDATWYKLIRSIHGVEGGFRNPPHSRLHSSPWRQIVKLEKDLVSYGINLPGVFKKKIGNGCHTLFWLDTWIGNEPLKDSFPRLFRLESNPLSLVCDRAPVSAPYNNSGTGAGVIACARLGVVQIQLPHGLLFRWGWNRNPLTPAEIEELANFTELVSHLHLNNDTDKWVCTFNESNTFTVRAMRLYISKANYPSTITQSRWNKYLPSKVNISSWRIKNRRLPTRLNLDKRGVDLHSVRCPICDDDLESENHIFVECIVAKNTWLAILKWWGIHNLNILSLNDAIELADRAPIIKKHIRYFDVVVQSTLWVLWNQRNESVFASKKPSKDLILNNIKLSSFTWIRSRAKLHTFSWVDWFNNPCNALSPTL